LISSSLIVNPYDEAGVAAASDCGLTMDRERCERHTAMLAVMRRNSLDAWRDRFVVDLRG
jgi:trehalose 6-phosphate synthase